MKHKEHLRGVDGKPACNAAGVMGPKIMDFVDFSDGVRLGWACKKCIEHWKEQKAARVASGIDKA